MTYDDSELMGEVIPVRGAKCVIVSNPVNVILRRNAQLGRRKGKTRLAFNIVLSLGSIQGDLNSKLVKRGTMAMLT